MVKRKIFINAGSILITSHGGGMVYAHDSKSCSRKGLRVQVPPMAPQTSFCLSPMDRAEIHAMASDVRANFERREVDPAQLAQLYYSYNPLEGVDAFIARASELFPS